MEEWNPVPKTYDPLKAGSIDGTDEIPHDKAIVRALNAKHKANKSVKGNPKCTIFVGKLSPDTVEETIEKAFQNIGVIKHVRLVRDIVTGYSKCYGFVEFADEHDAIEAVRQSHNRVIDEQEVYIDYEVGRSQPGWVPRRLGGGIGGRKESGQLRYGGRDRPFRKPIILSNTHGTSSFRDDHRDRTNAERYHRHYDVKRRDRYRTRRRSRSH